MNIYAIENDSVSGFINVGKSDMTLVGHINDDVSDYNLFYIAASPADHRATYTGSGLPFANQLQAFDSTPNKGVVPINPIDHSFQIDFMIPNSYMVGLGSVTIPPTLYIHYVDGEKRLKEVSIQVSNGIPYRMLTYPMSPRSRDGPEFYDSQFYLPVRSQEQILLDSGYPKTNWMPVNHWGLKPPL